MRTSAGLQMENVHVWRGALHVLKGVSLAAAPGELVHLAGPNGVGKTTLLRVASGLLRPEHGAVQWRGQCIRKFRADFQQELAYASHQAALKGDLTALENLEFSVGLKRNVERAQLQASLARTGVAHCAQLPARSLSAGQRRRVALALVLAMQAPLWLLDEPQANLDQEGVELVSQVLAEHVRAGGAAVVVAHGNMSVACPQRRVVLGS